MEEEFEIIGEKEEAFLPFYASGLVAGMTSILVSHPADTVKTRLQLATSKTSATEVVRGMYEKKGVAGFFKGVSSPLVGRAPLTALFFTSHEVIKPMLERSQIESRTKKAFIGGAWASLTLTPVLVPVELFKCQA